MGIFTDILTESVTYKTHRAAIRADGTATRTGIRTRRTASSANYLLSAR